MGGAHWNTSVVQMPKQKKEKKKSFFETERSSREWLLGVKKCLLTRKRVLFYSKGSQLGAFSHRSQCTVTLNSNFALFKSTFLRNRPYSNARWFNSKKHKIVKGSLYLIEHRFSRKEMWCAVVNHNYMGHICAKGFLDLNFNQAVIDKISIFYEIATDFTYS